VANETFHAVSNDPKEILMIRYKLGYLVVLFLFCSITVLAAGQSNIESYNGFQVASHEVLVKFNHSHSLQGALLDQAENRSVSEIVKQYGISETRLIGGINVHLFHSRGLGVAALIQGIKSRPDVEYVEPNAILHAIQTPNDPDFGSLYGMQKISAPSAWDISTGNTGTVVGVIDTGIDYTHPDLSGNVWTAPSAFTVTIGGTPITCAAGTHGFNAIFNICDPFDDNGHGTHVSGTIGAVGNNATGVVGVNWTTSVMGSKFLDSSGSGSTAAAINAIEFTIQAKLAFGSSANVRVLSNSWGGGPFDQSLLAEIARADGNNMLFVAAAGNNGTNNDSSPFYPASYGTENEIAVAATDSNDNLASFSNFGAASVQLGAPGVNILSTLPGATYGNDSGTSMATPHVSGAAALILSACNLNTILLRSDILQNVDVLSSLVSFTSTGGRLDVNKAIRACLPPLTSYSLGSTNAEVAYLGPDLHINQLSWNGTTWTNQDLTTNSGATNTAAFGGALSNYELNSSNAQIPYIGANHHIYQLVWGGPGTNWVNQDLTASSGATNNAATGSALTSYNLNSANAQIAYIGTNQHVYQLAWGGPGTNFVNQDLTATSGATNNAATGSALTSYILNSANAEIAYIGPNQHVYQLAWGGPGTNWVNQDLTAIAGAPLALAGSALASYTLGSTNAEVVFEGTNQHIYQLVWPGPGSNWIVQDLTSNAGGPLALAGTKLSSLVLGGGASAKVVYLGTNGHVYQLNWPGSPNNWVSQDLTAASGASNLADLGTGVSSFTLGSTNAEALYVGPNQHVYQLAFNGSTWVNQDLTVLSGGH
jgi:subtilisin family serine protease